MVLLLLAAWLVVPGCGGGGGGGGSAPAGAVSSGGGTTGGGGGTNPGTPDPLSPATTPAVPTVAPPRVNPRAASSEDVSGRTLNWQFQTGWTLFSFPLAELTSASGFTHQLYSYQGAGYVSVDPVANPGSIDTARAYWAYFEAPASVTVVGPDNTGQVNSTSLQAGWNLVGCPSVAALSCRNMTVTRPGGVPWVIEEATDASQSPGDAILYRYAYYVLSGQFASLDLLNGSSSLQPANGNWVFAWQQAELNFNVVPPSPAPTISSLSSTSLTPGASLTITGSGFGDGTTGQVVVGGLPVDASSITGWSSGSIQLTVPGGLSSGNLVVLVNRYPSNRVAVTVTSQGGTTGSLSGHVQSSTGASLQGALISLDSGHSAVSNSAGDFRIDGVPAGTHEISVTLIGYQPAAGTVTVVAGQVRTVLVSLTAVGGGGGGQTGTLRAVAHVYEPGATRYWVYRIEVQEYGNHSARWSNYWDTDLGDTSKTLTCSGAVVGRTYVVRVTWKTNAGQEATNYWYRTLNSTDQTEHFYSPY